MRFTTASLISSIIFLYSDVQAQPSLLEKRFRIDGPDYEYDDLQFLMEFEVSDFIKDNMLEYKLYDGMNCKDGGDNDITDNDGYLLSRIRTDNTPNGDGTGSRKVKVHSKIIGNQIKDSDIYRTNDDGDVVVEYCLRFGVYNQDKKEPMSFETNFLEIPVRLTIDMVGDFSIIAPLDVLPPILTGEEQGVAVEAYICDSDDNTVPIMPTEQGQTIRVCVSPVQEVLARNIVMRQIEQFTFRREIPDSVSQEAIEAGTGGVAADPLTVVSCRPGSVVCAFETLLTADFFSSPGIIIGTGLSYLQFAEDNAVAARRLEETTTLDEAFSINIAIELVPLESYAGYLETESSASTLKTGAVLIALVAIAGAMLFC